MPDGLVKVGSDLGVVNGDSGKTVVEEYSVVAVGLLRREHVGVVDEVKSDCLGDSEEVHSQKEVAVIWGLNLIDLMVQGDEDLENVLDGEVVDDIAVAAAAAVKGLNNWVAAVATLAWAQ